VALVPPGRLTVAELCAYRGLGLELVAGGPDAAARAIRWVSVSEQVDPTPWLSGGELVLTTGMALHDPAVGERFVRLLDQAGCAGLGFAVGLGHDVVPPELARVADDLRFPIFTVPYEVPFVAVTEVAMTRLVNEQAEAMRRALDVHERLSALVLGEQGLGALVEETASLTGFAVRLSDDAGALIAAAGDWPGPDEPPADATRLEIRSSDGLEAVLEAVAAGRPLDERDGVLLGHARTVIELELLKRRAVREAERRLAGDLVEELLEAGLPERELERHVRVFGFHDGMPLTFVLLRSRSHAPGELGRRAAEALAAGGVRGVVAARDGGVCALIEADDRADAEERATSLRASLEGLLGRGDLLCGVGLPRRRPSELRRSYDEALYALEASAALGGARIGTPSDLGSLQLILSLQDSRGMALFCDAVLGPLERHDRRSNARLCESLEAYIEANGRWADAAARLYVHRHTLRYRIQRIEDLTGRDLGNAHDRLEFWLALKAREVARRRQAVDGPVGAVPDEIQATISS
jgi:purine catabolism regulator